MSPLIILLIVLLYVLYKFAHDKPPNTPPGIIKIPILGSYPLLLWRNYKYPHKALIDYARKFKSKIISCYFRDWFAVVISDYDMSKEILKRKEFDGRFTETPILKDRAFGKSLGILFTEGEFWQQQKRFIFKNMRDFGWGRRQQLFENKNMEEMSLFLEFLRREPIDDAEKLIMKNNLILFPDILHTPICNGLWEVLFGYRFDRSEHDAIPKLSESSLTFTKAASAISTAIIQFPFLKFFGNMFGYKDIITSSYNIVNILQEHLEHCKSTRDNNMDRGLVDRYLKEMNKTNNKSDNFTEEQLIISIIDMLIPTLIIISSIITDAIKYLLHYPKILKKAQDEIDRVVGTGRLVSWDDRKNLPYIEAIIREVMRINTNIPMNIIHRCVKNTTLANYSIPQNTIIMINIWAIHNDPDIWDDPRTFKPERFINENGELIKDKTLHFSLGSRVCLGETHSKYTIFHILTVLLQNYNFSFVEGEPSGLEDRLPGLVITPKKLWIRLEAR